MPSRARRSAGTRPSACAGSPWRLEGAVARAAPRPRRASTRSPRWVTTARHADTARRRLRDAAPGCRARSRRWRAVATARASPSSDGRPAMRGSTRVASSSARATRLEHRLDHVVRVAPRRHADVQVHPAWVAKARKKSSEQLEVEAAELARAERHVVDEVRTPERSTDGLHQRLVERHGGVRRSARCPSCRPAPRGGPGRGRAHVLDRVVVVDVEIARGVDGRDRRGRASPGLEHVAEERDAGLDLATPRCRRGRAARRCGSPSSFARPRRLPAGPRLTGRGVPRFIALPPLPVTRRRGATVGVEPLHVGERSHGGRGRADRGRASITLVRVTKSSMPSGEAKRAVPPVGSTWFGPAT